MKAVVFVLASICFVTVASAQSNSLISDVQQTLKDQGFYYGEVTGQKDADTTAAIRRYQIRNGLQISGEMNAETQKSLGLKGNIPAPPRATPTAPPVDTSDLRDEAPAMPDTPRSMSGIFDGTPYEMAPPEVQRRVTLGAQSLLARRGYYRSTLDGVFGPGTEFALRAYQARFGMEPNGRLDMETLGSLGLLPGQQAPGLTAPRRRIFRRPALVAPNGERIYIPR